MDCFQSGDPQAGGFVVLLGLLPVVALQFLVVGFWRLFAVAVMRLVVDRQDVLHAHQLGQHALQHLAFAFAGDDLVAGAALEQLPPTLGNLDAFAQLEGVVVGDDDPGAAHVVEQVARHQFPFPVITVGIVGLQYAQPILDREARRADQEAARELPAGRATHGVDRLPGNQHGHHGRLARASGQLQRQSHQLGVGILVGCCQMVEKAFAMPGARSNFGQPDRRYRRASSACSSLQSRLFHCSASKRRSARGGRCPLAGPGAGRCASTSRAGRYRQLRRHQRNLRRTR